MAKWPVLLPNPSTSFKLNAAANGNRTSMASGYVRQRPTTPKTAYTASVVFELEDAQFEIFKAFIKYDINNGFDWFECPLAVGNEVTTKMVRIVSGNYQSNYVEYMSWRVSFNIDVKEIGVMDENYWIIITGDDFPEDYWSSGVLDALATCVNLGGEL